MRMSYLAAGSAALAVAVALLLGTSAVGQDGGQSKSGGEQAQTAPPSTRPAGDGAEAGTRRRNTARITLPWSLLDDLTAEQQQQIREIRTEILNMKDELDREERERILAVLSEAQQARVAELEAERAREQRERNRARRNSTTRPAGSGEGGGDDAGGE